MALGDGMRVHLPHIVNQLRPSERPRDHRYLRTLIVYLGQSFFLYNSISPNSLTYQVVFSYILPRGLNV